MGKLLRVVAVLAAIGGGAFWYLTRPNPLPAGAMAGLTGDPAAGARVFDAGGCASCHAAKGATGEARLILSGGQRLPSPFGTFIAPNISPDPDHGIGGWSALDLANAMQRGLSPDGGHYYPAFPYTTYARSTLQDVADLYAFLMTLPPSTAASLPHEVKFPFTIRRGIGLWQRRYLSAAPVVTGPLSPIAARGRYLVEALAHCGECHTPRDRFGGPDLTRWLAGAPNPEGTGRIPDIRPGRLTWSEGDIVGYLSTGFTPDYDSAGGLMVEVIENIKRLPRADQEAIAAYLKALAGPG
jgi:mono/diheme cytochrome c family protein